MFKLRGPLISTVALVVYLATNVGVRGLHHHPTPSPTPTSAAGQQLHSSAPAPGDCGNQTCQVCTILFLAQKLPTIALRIGVQERTGEMPAASAVSCPLALIQAVHSRGPPTR
ncbi:MAG: hypothetical protein JO112_23140 [Planctomycetes bacterium]|nr:hypothetical protein [Planctomycetota bacterium]